jgi:hypothetical protein
VSPDITLAPCEETTNCWFFQTTNTADLGISRWESEMTPGSHHMIVFFSNEMQSPPGTVSEECGIIDAGAGGSVWTYSAQTPRAEQQLPPGVGMKVEAGQYGFIQMHYLNSTEADLQAHVTLNVNTHPEGEAFVPAAPYITFHNEISIPPMSEASFGGSCTVPADKDFYQLGTHAHKQAVHMEVKNGTAGMVYETDSWSDADSAEWLAAPFQRFTSGKLEYRCDYYNPTNRTITTGDSAATDEMCMAVGYMFPAERPTLCVHFNGQDYVLPG